MKLVNIGLSALLLALPGCGLFTSVPPSVVRGQQGVYQGLSLAEENNEAILNRYEQDCKAAVVYHLNFVYETKIKDAESDQELTSSLEQERDAAIADAFAGIEKVAQEMRKKSSQNLMLTKKLTESVYNYMSSTPIDVSSVDFWLERMRDVSKW